MRNRIRRALAQLIAPPVHASRRARTTVAALAALAALALSPAAPRPAVAASSADAAGAAQGSINDQQAQQILDHFHPRTPGEAVHTEFDVEVNKLGQVTRIRKGVSSKNDSFNSMTYGNALQAFIRTADGRAISGLYRLTYDYDPKTKLVKRDVALLHPGGVDPNAVGAVIQMQQLAEKRAEEGDALPDVTAAKRRHPRR